MSLPEIDATVTDLRAVAWHRGGKDYDVVHIARHELQHVLSRLFHAEIAQRSLFDALQHIGSLTDVNCDEGPQIARVAITKARRPPDG